MKRSWMIGFAVGAFIGAFVVLVAFSPAKWYGVAQAPAPVGYVEDFKIGDHVWFIFVGEEVREGKIVSSQYVTRNSYGFEYGVSQPYRTRVEADSAFCLLIRAKRDSLDTKINDCGK